MSWPGIGACGVCAFVLGNFGGVLGELGFSGTAEF